MKLTIALLFALSAMAADPPKPEVSFEAAKMDYLETYNRWLESKLNTATIEIQMKDTTEVLKVSCPALKQDPATGKITCPQPKTEPKPPVPEKPAK